MPSTTFVDYSQNTPITASWLNGVNNFIFGGMTSPLAWVRFNGTTGVILQSYGLANANGVVRNSLGNYTINYAAAVPNSANMYQITTNQAGFDTVFAETAASVTINTQNTVGAQVDPTIVCLLVFGQYTPNF